MVTKGGGGGGGAKMNYLAAGPVSFETSSSILVKISFLSSFAAAKNSFTNASKVSTIPAYIKNENSN